MKLRMTHANLMMKKLMSLQSLIVVQEQEKEI